MTAGRPILVARLGIVAAPVSTLAQLFGTNLNEVWATTKENTGYSGFAFTAQRADNSASFNIPFTDGKHADPSYISNFSGTTALVSTVYGQINGLNAVQATAVNMMFAFIDTDGFWSFGFPRTFSTTTKVTNLVVADNVLLRPANPHLFCLMNPGPCRTDLSFPNIGEGIFCCYSGTGSAFSVGRYGLGVSLNIGGSGTPGFWTCRNGTAPNTDSIGVVDWTIGEAHCVNWHVWDMSCSTQELRFDGQQSSIAAVLQASQGAATVTYPANTQFNIGSDASLSNQTYWGAWRLIALYGATQASRDSISNFLMNDSTTVNPLPTSFTDSDGFVYTPQYYPKQGSPRLPADLFGLTWHDEFGGYPDRGNGASFAIVNNLTNPLSANLVRFALQPFDSDILITGAQRAERGAYASTIAPGSNAAYFCQFLIEPGSAQTGSWSIIHQIHTSTGSASDIVFLLILNELFQVNTQNTTTGNAWNPQGSSVAIVRAVWWAYLVRMQWSSTGTTDSLQVYLGQNGSTLTQIVNLNSVTLWNTASVSAYPKQGLYTGDHGQNPAIALRVANQQWSSTLTAFDGFITSQPALPAH